MSAPYRVSLRVRRKHLDQIKQGSKLVELRRRSSFWFARLERLRLGKSHGIAVFLCGRETHRRYITDVKVGYARQFLGRPPSDEGRRDIGDGLVYAIFLGEEIPDGS